MVTTATPRTKIFVDEIMKNYREQRIIGHVIYNNINYHFELVRSFKQSLYGIGEKYITGLSIYKNHKNLAEYDTYWISKPENDSAKHIYRALLRKFNNTDKVSKT